MPHYLIQEGLRITISLARKWLSLSKLSLASAAACSSSKEGAIDYLMANPILVTNFKPLSRDEIYDRC